MDQEKKFIRATISSILLSSPFTLTVGLLIKDYKATTGDNIPFQRFGFKSVEEFLRSFPDFEIYGQGSGAQITAKVTPKSAHIDKLIVEQKVTAPKSRKKISRPQIRRYKSTPLHREQSNFVPSQASKHQNAFVSSVQVKTNLPSTSSKSFETANQHLNKEQYNRNVPPPYKETNFSFPSTSGAKPTQDINLPPYLETCQPKSKMKANKPSFIPLQAQKRHTININIKSTAQDLSQGSHIRSTNSDLAESPSATENVCLENYFSSLSDEIKTSAKGAVADLSSKSAFIDDVFVSDSEDEDYVNCRVPAEVQQNLNTLIKKYPNGLWCNELPDVYRTTFWKTLDHADYGYKTLMALCMDLDRIFHCIRPDRGDIKLYDKSKPLPLDATNSLHFADILKNTEIVDYPKDNALPDVSDIVMYRKQNEMPPDVVHLFEELPRQWISEDVKPMSFIDIDVGEIYDPSKFWIILRGPETSQKLDELMDEMQDFYSAHRELLIPENKLELGLYCAAVILGEYHRAIIVHLMPHIEGQIKVFFVDYGTVSLTLARDICYLHRKFFALPQQAIRARLANIYPPTEKIQWSRKSASAFLEMVFQKSMVAQVYKIDEKRKALELFIADTSGEEDYYVNDKLTELGHAIFTYQEQIPLELPLTEEPNVRYIHLFPTFDELEQGLVPTATQMERMLETGLELHHIYPQYYKKIDDPEDFTNWPKLNSNKRENITNISRYMKSASEENDEVDLMDFSSNQQYFSDQSEPLIDLMSNFNCGTNSYENIMGNTNSYNFPVLTPEILPTKPENNYTFSNMNSEASGLSNYDLTNGNKTLNTNLGAIKKQIEINSCSKGLEDNYSFGEFSSNASLTPSSIESRLDGLKIGTNTNESKSLAKEPSYSLTASHTSSQKNDKKEETSTKASSSFEVSTSLDSSEKQKNPSESNTTSGNSKKKQKKVKNNVVKKNTSKTVRPPPGFEGTLSVTSNSTQNVIPSVQQNFINLFVGNQPTLYPYNSGLFGVIPNFYQLQQQLLLQEILKNHLVIDNIQRQQQLITQQEQNIGTQLNSNNNTNNCKVVEEKKMLTKIDFYEKTFHLIRYTNEIYCSVQEVQKVFFGDKWPIMKLKRHIAVRDPQIQIQNFHRNECLELTRELVQAGVVTEEELSTSMCLLHLIAFKDLPKLINAVSHSKMDFTNFDQYLLKYDYNSNAWL